MAIFTKGQVRTAVRQAIDDPGSKRWSDANLDQLITLVMDNMFQAILDTFEFYTQASGTFGTNAQGYVSGVNTSLGNRFYRILKVVVTSSSVELQPKLHHERVPQGTYYLAGNNLYTEPAVVSANLSITFSYLPTAFTLIASDVTSLPSEFPWNHEAALIYAAASWALTKGGAESLAQVGRIADVAVDAMITHLARAYPLAANQRLQAIKNAIMRQTLEPIPAGAQ